jgi:hypothetical protein
MSTSPCSAGRPSLRAICERDPEVGERYKRGKAKAIAHVANGLLQKARAGCTTSSIFYLKTQAGWRETDRLEHTGPNGSPVTTIVRQIVSPQEKLKALIDGYAERMNDADTSEMAQRLEAKPATREDAP